MSFVRFGQLSFSAVNSKSFPLDKESDVSITLAKSNSSTGVLCNIPIGVIL